MIRTIDYSKALAALFAVLMVVSMMAPAAGAAVAADAGDATPTTEGAGASPAFSDEVSYEQTSDGEFEQQDASDVDIDPALERKFEGDAESTGGTVDVVVRLSPADTSGVQGQAATVDALKGHAAETQQNVVRFAQMSEHVELERQFWITNAVLLEVNPDRVSLEEIASAEGVERLHVNFEVTTAQASGGNNSTNGTSGDAPTNEMSEDTPTNETSEDTSTNETSSDAPATEASSEDATADAEPIAPSSMQTENYSTTYGLDMINATEVWDAYNTQGDGVEVAVLDSGMDDSHPDLPELDDEHWQSWDSDGNPIDSEPSDSSGHGTHVSGTVAGAEDPAGDVSTFGVAPDVELYHGQVIPAGGGSFAQVAAGMEWAVDTAEVDIVSMSLGAPGYAADLIEPSENARDAGVILVASAGNDGDGNTGSPGNVYPNFASGAVNEDAEVASFSGGETIDTSSAWGSDAPDDWPDEYVVPNAAAPGVDVLSSVPGGGYDGTYSGTSMSAPHKTGAFALVLSAAGGDLDRQTAIEAIEDTAWKPDDAPEPPGTPDTRYGVGIIDAKAAADQVALDSGVTGTVTDGDGEPVEGATIEVEESGFGAETGPDGEYTVLSPPGNYTVTASGFGYEETSESVSIPDNETFVEQNITLADALGVEPVAGQPDAIEGGQQFEIQVNVANLDTYSVERTGGYNGSLTFELNGDEIEEGEEVSLGGISGTATLTVTTKQNTEGELSLDHTFSGAGDTVSVTTGPTTVFSEFTPIAVVDDGSYGDDVVDRLTDQLPASYEISLLTGSEAVDAAANDEHEAYVVQDIDETHVEDLKSNTAGASTGVVWLDQWGSGSTGVPARSSALGDPTSTSDSFASPNPEMEIVSDSPLFEGVGEAGDTFGIHSANFADHAWFEGTDFQTVGYVQAGGVTDGPAAATNGQEREVLLSTFGSTAFVESGDYSDDADAVLANAASWAATTPPVVLNEGQPAQNTPGERFGSEYSVQQLEKVKVSLHEDSTANQSELDLYVGGTVNAWDEWRAYSPPRTDDDYTVEVESEDDTVGSVILETTFTFANNPDAVGDGGDIAPEDSHEVTITTGPTAVYDPPLTVGDGGDVETIQEAVDLAPAGVEIGVTEGTYAETVSVEETQNLTISGENATIVAPDSGGDDGHAHVDIQAAGTHFEGFDLETPAALAGVGVSGASDVDVTDVSVTGASDAVQVVESSDVNVTDASAAGSADNGVHVADSEAVDVTDAEATDAGTGVRIADSADVAVDAPAATNVSYGVMLDGATDTAVTGASVEDAGEAGIASMGSNGVEITDATVTDAGYGVHVDGGSVANLTDASVVDSEYGIAAEGGAAVADAAHNEIANATTGFAFSGSATSGEFANNDVNATTGVLASDAGGDLTFHFNDLAETETAMAAESGTFEAPLNWFGTDGPQANNGVEGDVRYSPFLTANLGEVDTNTTQIAVDLTMEANETYTVGVPAATDQTVGDAFDDEFEGAIYGYDAEIGDWQMLTANDSLSALSAVLVVAEEDTYATFDFQSGDEPASPGQVDLHNGWNLVSPSAYHDEEYAFWTDGTNKGDGDYYTPSTWMVAESHADGHVGEGTVADSTVNPFGGYWVGIGAEGDGYTLFSELEQDPTVDDYRALLDPETPTAPQPPGESPGEGPSEPEDVSVAVVDENDYHEGAIASALSEELDDDVYTSVDTLTADELLDEMDGYDVFVVQRFGSDSLASDFADALADDQAVVYLDSDQGGTAEAYADGIYRLNNVRDDPAERESVSLDADDQPVEVDVQSDHPIFDGVGSEGESVTVVESDITWGSWFNDYDGQVLGHSDFSPSDEGEFEGPGVAIDEDRNEVLNTAIAMDFFHDDPDDFTDAGLTLFANSVEEAASMAASSDGTAAAEEDEEAGTQPDLAPVAAPAA
ncbi:MULTISPECIES: S8 family serine peptidase [Halorubrum]|uniref:Subtilisin-like serine protease n=1 Tax=Halorubrum hochstenium ATCC 700873 TaxID=1227481 RepID=M0FL16_9EURY|nr:MULTISPECIES: S8 family serine peptidase [Halorubrum]ELZ59284.1 subtilisin-like serine protease [Halorubrum hochstenium ATCC 700873]